MSEPGATEERDLRAAFDALVGSGPPVGFGSARLIAAGRRARRRRDLLTGGVAAALAAAVLGAAVLAGGLGRPDPAPPADRVPSPELVAGPIPGLGAEEAERTATSCRSTAAGVHPGARLYDTAEDAFGRVALMYGPDTVVICVSEAQGQEGGTGGLGTSAGWLPGAVVVDHDWSADRRTGRYWAMAVGRVAGTVARVEGRLRTRTGTVTASVRPVNGAYVVRVPLPPGQDAVAAGITVAAYDAAGRLLDTTSLPDPGPCHVMPDGTVLDNGGPRAAGQQCAPAVRWP